MTGELLPSVHPIGREYRVISVLAPNEVPVPRTFALCEDPDVFGSPFYVMEHVRGTHFLERFAVRTDGCQPKRHLRRGEPGKQWRYYLAFNLFRLAGILQGVAARSVNGNASSPHAILAASRVTRHAARLPRMTSHAWTACAHRCTYP